MLFLRARREQGENGLEVIALLQSVFGASEPVTFAPMQPFSLEVLIGRVGIKVVRRILKGGEDQTFRLPLLMGFATFLLMCSLRC